MNQLKTHDFSDSDINQIINIFKERSYIKSAIRVETKASGDAMDYHLEFRDYDESPYIRELHLGGKSFHKKHSNRMTRIIINYWKPIVEGKLLG